MTVTATIPTGGFADLGRGAAGRHRGLRHQPQRRHRSPSSTPPAEPALRTRARPGRARSAPRGFALPAAGGFGPRGGGQASWVGGRARRILHGSPQSRQDPEGERRCRPRPPPSTTATAPFSAPWPPAAASSTGVHAGRRRAVLRRPVRRPPADRGRPDRGRCRPGPAHPLRPGPAGRRVAVTTTTARRRATAGRSRTAPVRPGVRSPPGHQPPRIPHPPTVPPAPRARSPPQRPGSLLVCVCVCVCGILSGRHAGPRISSSREPCRRGRRAAARPAPRTAAAGGGRGRPRARPDLPRPAAHRRSSR